AVSIDLGDDLRLITLLKTRQATWGEVGRFVLIDLNKPLRGVVRLSIILVDGTRRAILCSRSAGERAFELARTKRLAHDWPGLTLGRGLVLCLFTLGSFVTFVGLWLAFGVFLSQGVSGQTLLAFVLFGVAAPILGLVALGYAVYHAIRRPKVVLPGL